MVKEFPSFYEEDESTIRERVLGRIADDWRKEQGDYVYDTVAAVPAEVKDIQISQDDTLKNAFPQYAVDEWLDEHLDAIGMTREPATYAERTLEITADAGVIIPIGQVVSSVVLDDGGNPLEFVVTFGAHFLVEGTVPVTLKAQGTGAIYNVKTDSSFILTPPIPGVRVVTDAGPTIVAQDRETDEEAYARYDYAVRNPDTGGNKHDYVRWSQDHVTGVGKAKCIPRWSGNGTVKVLLLGEDFRPASAAVVTAAQTYLDPGSTGLGDGKAPCGAKVTAAAATQLTINVAATVTYASTHNAVDVKAAFTKTLDAYFRDLAFSSDAALQSVVWAKVGALLITTPGVANYSDLKVNTGVVDIPITNEQVPVAGTVTM